MNPFKDPYHHGTMAAQASRGEGLEGRGVVPKVAAGCFTSWLQQCEAPQLCLLVYIRPSKYIRWCPPSYVNGL